MDKKNKNIKMYIVITISMFILSCVGITYAFINSVDPNKKSAEVLVEGKTACINIDIETLNSDLSYNYPKSYHLDL